MIDYSAPRTHTVRHFSTLPPLQLHFRHWDTEFCPKDLFHFSCKSQLFTLLTLYFMYNRLCILYFYTKHVCVCVCVPVAHRLSCPPPAPVLQSAAGTLQWSWASVAAALQCVETRRWRGKNLKLRSMEETRKKMKRREGGQHLLLLHWLLLIG